MDDTQTGTRVGADGLERCWWCGDDPLYMRYHDEEWGRPIRDDQRLFELLCLEGFQSGLSWITILRKREGFRAAFAGFDVDAVAAFDEADVQRLLEDPEIVRHRGKITATIANARAVKEMKAAGTSLTAVVWSHAPDQARPRLTSRDAIPSQTPESTELSRSLRKWGMRFVGPTTAYAFMQSAGLVDDHLAACHRAGQGDGQRRTKPRAGSGPVRPSRRIRRPAATTD